MYYILSILLLPFNNIDNEYKEWGKVFLTYNLSDNKSKAENAILNQDLFQEELYVNKEGSFYINSIKEKKNHKLHLTLIWEGEGVTQISKLKIDEHSITDFKHIESKLFETHSGKQHIRHTYYSKEANVFFTILIDYNGFISF
jgi:hypothetical protein